MVCPECEKGMVVVLRTKGHMHPHREGSILTHPEKYFSKVPCPSCEGSGIAFISREEGTSNLSSDSRLASP